LKRKDDYGLEKVFGERLADAMEDNGVTVEDMETDDIAVSSVINSYISGKSLPQLRTAVRIATYLNVSLDYLCGLDDGDIESIHGLSGVPWDKIF
jgi:transcriptional regulator with XRE-family HTH domain